MMMTAFIPWMADVAIRDLNLILMLVSASIVILTIINIFSFNNRKRQLILCYVVLVLLVIPCLIFFKGGVIESYDTLLPPLKIAYFFPLVAIVADIFAIIGIKRDEKLVRSMDRLR
jgi:NADH:ubiquinone oxidoreductase subunit 2 (subunit N)